MQYPRKYQVKKVMKFQVLKVESANSTMSGSHFSWLIYDSSNNVNYVEWCLQKGRPRYCWQNQICYCKKSINVKVLFFLIKVWNMKNVSIWFQQKPIPQLSMFCLIQVINNYVQINIYWSYTVRICIFINLASNILLLASKKCFLTSQGHVGAGMNCRALMNRISSCGSKGRGGAGWVRNAIPDMLLWLNKKRDTRWAPVVYYDLFLIYIYIPSYKLQYKNRLTFSRLSILCLSSLFSVLNLWIKERITLMSKEHCTNRSQFSMCYGSNYTSFSFHVLW
jgi:hypothetical protein